MGNLSGESREQIRKDKVTRFRSVTYARQLGLLVNTLGSHLKISEFAFFQPIPVTPASFTLSNASELFLSRIRTNQNSSSEIERKFMRRLFRSSIKREIRNFHVV